MWANSEEILSIIIFTSSYNMLLPFEHNLFQKVKKVRQNSYCVHKILLDAKTRPPVQATTIPLQPKGLRGKNHKNLKILKFENLDSGKCGGCHGDM